MLLVKLSEQNVWLFPDKAFIDIFDFTVQAEILCNIKRTLNPL